MKTSMLSPLFFGLIVAFVSAQTQPKVSIIQQNLKYCESTLWNGDDLYIANFGSSQLNPLNQEGKGYIVKYRDGKISTLVAADGNLNAPKGMAIKDNYLFVADVNKILVYNIANLQAKPHKIAFPKDDLFVNDLAIHGNTLYATVTNTGKLYSIDITEVKELATEATFYLEIPGPNGILIVDNKMYIGSYNPAGTPTAENVIYVINDIKNPKPEYFTDRFGQYDGLAMSPDNKTLYFSDWVQGRVGSIDMSTKKVNYITPNIKNPLIGPADFSLKNGALYIPDLPNSRVVIIKTK